MEKNISRSMLDGATGLAFQRAREEVEEGIKAMVKKTKTPSKLPTLTK